jgi:hypothetical protein
MTVGQLHNSQRFMLSKCTLATCFIHALFALIVYQHSVLTYLLTYSMEQGPS